MYFCLRFIIITSMQKEHELQFQQINSSMYVILCHPTFTRASSYKCFAFTTSYRAFKGTYIYPVTHLLLSFLWTNNLYRKLFPSYNPGIRLRYFSQDTNCLIAWKKMLLKPIHFIFFANNERTFFNPHWKIYNDQAYSRPRD